MAKGDVAQQQPMQAPKVDQYHIMNQLLNHPALSPSAQMGGRMGIGKPMPRVGAMNGAGGMMGMNEGNGADLAQPAIAPSDPQEQMRKFMMRQISYGQDTL